MKTGTKAERMFAYCTREAAHLDLLLSEESIFGGVPAGTLAYWRAKYRAVRRYLTRPDMRAEWLCAEGYDNSLKGTTVPQREQPDNPQLEAIRARLAPSSTEGRDG